MTFPLIFGNMNYVNIPGRSQEGDLNELRGPLTFPCVAASSPRGGPRALVA